MGLFLTVLNSQQVSHSHRNQNPAADTSCTNSCWPIGYAHSFSSRSPSPSGLRRHHVDCHVLDCLLQSQVVMLDILQIFSGTIIGAHMKKQQGSAVVWGVDRPWESSPKVPNPPHNKKQMSTNSRSGHQLGISVHCSKDTAVTCHVLPVLECGSGSDSSYDSLERATSFITVNLQVVQKPSYPGARSHQLLTFTIVEISFFQPDKLRLSPSPSVQLRVQVLGEDPVKVIPLIHTFLILWSQI